MLPMFTMAKGGWKREEYFKLETNYCRNDSNSKNESIFQNQMCTHKKLLAIVVVERSKRYFLQMDNDVYRMWLQDPFSFGVHEIHIAQ